MSENLKVTARLNSIMAAEPPQLDALLIAAVLGHQRQKLRNSGPCPPFGDVSIPLAVSEIGWMPFSIPVYRTSSPICGAAIDRHERRQRYIDANRFASLIDPSRRHAVTAVKYGWMKKDFRPIRVRTFGQIVWFCHGDGAEISGLLDTVPSIGGDRARGYGRVAWSVEAIECDWSVISDRDGEKVLMRRVPAAAFLDVYGPVSGAAHSFGACQPPYYHPDRQMEILEPA